MFSCLVSNIGIPTMCGEFLEMWRVVEVLVIVVTVVVVVVVIVVEVVVVVLLLVFANLQSLESRLEAGHWPGHWLNFQGPLTHQ